MCHSIAASRYHSIVYAVNAGVPFAPLYTTPKVGRLLSDLRVSQCVIPRVDNAGFVCEPLRGGELVSLVVNILESENLCDAQQHMYDIPNITKLIEKGKRQVPYIKLNRLREAPTQSNDEYHEAMLSGIIQVLPATPVKDLYRWYMTGYGGELLGWSYDDIQTIATYICYKNFGTLSNPYVWGLAQKMLISIDPDEIEEEVFIPRLDLEWLLGQARKAHNESLLLRFDPKLPFPKYTLRVDPNSLDLFKGVHRAGWYYAMGGILPF